MLILALLLGCYAPPSGRYVLTIADPVTTCPAAEVPTVPERATVHLSGSDASVLVSPLDEACPLAGERFRCSVAPWDLVADYGDLGFDAVVTRDISFEGAWMAGERVAGELLWQTTCEGADCAVIDAPAPCSTTWAWSGASTLPGGEAVHCGSTEPAVERVEALGPAPWDPVRLRVNEDAAAVRLTVLADATPITLEPYVVPGLVDAEADLYVPVEEHPGKTLSIVGAWTVPADIGWSTEFCPEVPAFQPVDTEWTVGRFGRDATFVPDMALGSWVLAPGTVLAAGQAEDLGTMLVGFADGTRLEVLAAEEGEAEIRLVARIYGTEAECVLLHDTAELSGTGELTWSRDRIDAATVPDPLVLHEPRLRIGFDGDGAEAAGGEFSATIDLRATEGTEYAICDFGASFGASCEACPDDGHVSCLPVTGLAWVATRSDIPSGQDLPLCGADFSDTGVVPDYDIDCDGGGSLCVGAWLILLAPLLRRSRPIVD